jgi:hypothetical protein
MLTYPSLHASRGRSSARLVALLFASIVATGCGGDPNAPPIVKVYDVKGKVVLADGKPLTDARIFFVPKDGIMTPVGTVGSDGSFSLRTGQSGEGAAPGEYKVRIEPEDASLLPGAKAPAKGKKLPFPAKYLDEDTSHLIATVKAESNQLEPFRLK